MAKYDIPAMLNYVTKVTGQKKVIAVAGSFGCTVLFMAMSTRPDIDDKIELMFAFAPVVNLSHTRSRTIPVNLFYWRLFSVIYTSYNLYNVIHWQVNMKYYAN